MNLLHLLIVAIAGSVTGLLIRSVSNNGITLKRFFLITLIAFIASVLLLTACISFAR